MFRTQTKVECSLCIHPGHPVFDARAVLNSKVSPCQILSGGRFVHRCVQPDMSIKAKIAVHHAQRVKKDPQGHERVPAPLRLARRVHVQRTYLPNMDVVVVGDRMAPRERFELPRERAHAISSRAHYQAMRSRLYFRRAPFLV